MTIEEQIQAFKDAVIPVISEHLLESEKLLRDRFDHRFSAFAKELAAALGGQPFSWPVGHGVKPEDVPEWACLMAAVKLRDELKALQEKKP